MKRTTLLQCVLAGIVAVLSSDAVLAADTPNQPQREKKAALADPAVPRDPTHTSNSSVKLQEHCKSVGVPCELVYPNAPDVKHATTSDYLIQTLKPAGT